MLPSKTLFPPLHMKQKITEEKKSRYQVMRLENKAAFGDRFI